MRLVSVLTAAFLISVPVTAQSVAAAHPALGRLRHALTPKLARRAKARPVAATSGTAPAAAAAFPQFEQNPINQLRGNARVLVVFAPDAATPALRQQMLLLARHELDLTTRDTVLVSVVPPASAVDFLYSGESVPSGSSDDQTTARQKFGVERDDFAVVLLDREGHEVFRSAKPISAADLARRLDAAPQQGGIFQEVALVSRHR